MSSAHDTEHYNPTLLILGFGPRLSLSTARLFASKGYRVAVVSRTTEQAQYPEFLVVKGDLAEEGTVERVFGEVEGKWGKVDVVVYTAALFPSLGTTHLLDIPPASITNHFRVNTLAPLTALQLLLHGALNDQEEPPKPDAGGKKPPPTFLYATNLLPSHPQPTFWTLGFGKSAMSHILQCIAHTQCPPSTDDENEAAVAKYFSDLGNMTLPAGVRIHSVDERNEEGGMVQGGEICAERWAEVFWELVNGEGERAVEVKFSKEGGIWEGRGK